ncbi:hypothetical protein B9G79_16405 [Bdellovibrio bacteriovorus]|uniref:Uncharacterized protein n=2 Tax=Bdellovibrio bacteriovorus TaxID=959 RepID=A0A1Z3NC66_BDEBC|nr:hypothetical protein B9G79_16405 [Bdellovibrio bacteriovorus]
MISFAFTTGCLEEASKTSEIVIDPGALIQIDATEVRTITSEKYSFFIAEYSQTTGLIKNLVDLSSLEKKNLVQTILPKGVSSKGPMVLKTIMEYSTTTWYSLIFPDVVVKPSLESTLAFNLISNYPDRSISSYSSLEFEKIIAYITQFKKERMELFGLQEGFNTDLLYGFIRNGLSVDHTFLELLKNDFQVSFNYDANGDVLSAPYPFGVNNRAPILDEKSSTKLVDQRIREQKELSMRATARDPEGDQLFYAWRLEGTPVASDEGRMSWTPGYDDGRLDPFLITVLITDGGKILTANWDVYVEDVNRRPISYFECPKEARENQEWTCTVQFLDDDGDPLSVVVDSISGSRPIYVDGNPSPVTLTGKTQITMKWTPNNEDARKRSTNIIARIEDGRGGLAIVTIPLTIVDINSAPVIAGLTPKDPTMTPGEWDTCSDQDPLGRDPYTFYVDITDPDNVATPAADPMDTMEITIGGTLFADLTEVPPREITAARTRITYTWKPMRAALKGNITVSVKDNHGGISKAEVFDLEAEPRITVPCLLTRVPQTTLNSVNPQVIRNLEATSYSGSPVWFEFFSFDSTNLDSLKLMYDNSTGYPLVLKETISSDGPVYRKEGGTFPMRTVFAGDVAINNVAGYVVFSRATTHTGDVVIPKNFAVTTTSGVSGNVVAYKTALAVTLNAQDLKAYIPVVAVNRDAAANSVTVLGSALADAQIAVKNTAVISDQGLVTFYRPGIFATDVTIPKGFVVKTTGNPSIEFEIPTAFVFPAASSSVSVPVWRKRITFNAGDAMSITSAQPGGPVLSATTGSNLVDVNAGNIWKDDKFLSGNTTREFKYRALDGYISDHGTINTIVSALPAGAATLTVDNPASLALSKFTFEGKVRFSRTSTTTAFTIPAGFIVRNSLFALYSVISPVNFAVGQTTADVWVKRTSNIGRYDTLTSDPRYISELPYQVRYSYWNTSSRLVSSSVIYANEGIDLTDGIVELSDSGSGIPSPYYQVDPYWYPIDKFDYFSMGIQSVGTAPQGAYKFCREAGATYASTCTPCTNTAPGAAYQGYFESSRCYLRYQPHDEDLSGTFSFKLTGYEYPSWSGGSTSAAAIIQTNLSLVVVEKNVAPILSDSSFAPLAAGVGTTIANPIDMGTFQEGKEGSFYFYLKDPNRGTELKTVSVSLLGTRDLKNGTDGGAPGVNVSLTINKREDDPSGKGSRTTALFKWTPTDGHAKAFSGAAGIILKMRATDASTSPAISKSQDLFFKVRVVNTNQYPTFGGIATNNQLAIEADTYFYKDFFVNDKDMNIPGGGTFVTKLTLCKNNDGTNLLHPTLDTSSSWVTTCHAQSKTWSEEITTFDPSYNRNLGIATCVKNGVVNPDFAVPKLYIMSTGTNTSSGVRFYYYRLQWCPQRGHIGTHTATLYLTDNGDVDRDGVALTPTVSSAPLRLIVKAPPYFISPRSDLAGQPLHFMPQTAGGLATYPFTYKTIVSNSRGNTLTYTLLNSPRACGVANGMCVDSNGVITWTPKIPDDVTPSGGTGHVVRIQIKDTKTNETDTTYFNLIVQDPYSPLEQAPVINSYFPASDSVLVTEKSESTFQVTATDSNANDTLFYRWYVNGVLTEDEGPEFKYKPNDSAGSLVNTGQTTAGIQKIKVEVTDGNFVTTREWTARVRNVYLLAESVFNLSNARKASPSSFTPSSITWLNEVPYSVNSASGNLDHLIFSGSYKNGSSLKNFVWDFLSIKGVAPTPNGSLKSGSVWNFYETLPWASGFSTQRLAVVQTSASAYKINLVSQPGRSGPYSTTAQAVSIAGGDLTALSLGSGNKCDATCFKQLYTSTSASGNRIVASFGDYVFYASDAQDALYYDYLLPGNGGLVYSFNAAKEKISGMAYSANLDRLYVATQQESPIQHKMYVFNVYPVKSGNLPTLVSSFNIWNGLAADVDTRPTDIVLDDTTNKVYVLLTGTGEIASFADGSGVTPLASDLQFFGKGTLSASPFDVAGQGRRFVLNSADRTLVGTMRDSNQIFTMDLTNNKIYTSSAPNPIDSIAVYTSGQILLISRSTGNIYRAK